MAAKREVVTAPRLIIGQVVRPLERDSESNAGARPLGWLGCAMLGFGTIELVLAWQPWLPEVGATLSSGLQRSVSALPLLVAGVALLAVRALGEPNRRWARGAVTAAVLLAVLIVGGMAALLLGLLGAPFALEAGPVVIRAAAFGVCGLAVAGITAVVTIRSSR